MAWVWAFPLNGMLGLAGYLIARHAFRQAPGLPRVLAGIVVSWAWVTVGMEVLGSIGLLSLEPLLAWSGAGLVAGLVAKRLDSSKVSPVTAVSKPTAEPWEWEATAAIGLVLCAVLLLGARSLLLPVKVVSDGPIYHLYFATRWWKAGRILLIATPFGENAAPYFPAVGDLWFTWLMVSWGGDRLAKIGQAPFLLVCGLAAFAIARRLGSRASSAILAAAWFITSTPFLLFSFEPNVDTIFIAGYLLASYFFLRFALGDDGRNALILGALAAGGALGTKTVGVVFVPPLLLCVGLFVLTRHGSIRDKAVRLLVLVVCPLLMAGYWFGRNVVLTGNPLYPLRVVLFGREWLSGWYGAEVMRLSPYFMPIGDLRALIDQMLAACDPRLAPIWAAALAGAWSLRRREPQLKRGLWGCSALALANVALFWILIPYRTQQRFMLQALGLAAAPLAATFDLGRAVRTAGVVLLTLHLITAQNWPFADLGIPTPWDLSPLIPSASPGLVPLPASAEELRLVWMHPRALNTVLSTLGFGVAAIAIAWTWRIAVVRGGAARWAIATAAAILSAAVAYVGTVPPNLSARRLFYPEFPDYIAGWSELDLRAGPTGARIAYAGTNLPYYLMGVGLRNDVRYINVDTHRDWLLHDYHREASSHGSATWPHPRPGWDRIHPDYQAWLENLRAERIQMLVVARANPAEGPHNLADLEGFPIEKVWADAHPEVFIPLYGVTPRDPRFRIYRVRPAARSRMGED